MRTQIEEYGLKLAEKLDGSITFDDCSIDSIIKCIEPRFDNSYELLIEKLIDFFELVRKFDRDKMFILYNLRSIISDREFKELVNETYMKSIELLFIESSERTYVGNVKRVIIDNDLCMI